MKEAGRSEDSKMRNWGKVPHWLLLERRCGKELHGELGFRHGVRQIEDEARGIEQAPSRVHVGWKRDSQTEHTAQEIHRDGRGGYPRRLPAETETGSFQTAETVARSDVATPVRVCEIFRASDDRVSETHERTGASNLSGLTLQEIPNFSNLAFGDASREGKLALKGHYQRRYDSPVRIWRAWQHALVDLSQESLRLRLADCAPRQHMYGLADEAVNLVGRKVKHVQQNATGIREAVARESEHHAREYSLDEDLSLPEHQLLNCCSDGGRVCVRMPTRRVIGAIAEQVSQEMQRRRHRIPLLERQGRDGGREDGREELGRDESLGVKE